jgi:hypothetical protein
MLDINELRAMAERVGAVREADKISHAEMLRVHREMYGQGEPSICNEVDNDVAELVDFACELLDQRPLTPEVVKEMGAVHHCSGGQSREAFVIDGDRVTLCFWFRRKELLDCLLSGKWTSVKTIGQLRALCLALGIEITKGGE